MLQEQIFMNWKPVYVVGKEGFEKEVLRALEHSGIAFMPGYLPDDLQPTEHALFWIDQATSIRELKKAITAKLVFKYRLRTYEELEAFISEQNTPEESFPEMPEPHRLSA